MTPNELIAEHRAFLGVYRARISRARQVRSTYTEMLTPLLEDRDRAEKAIRDLENENGSADYVVEQYEAKLEDTTRIISDLENSRGITRDSSGMRKKPTRLSKLLRLQRKLTAMLEEDPDLAEYLDTMEDA